MLSRRQTATAERWRLTAGSAAVVPALEARIQAVREQVTLAWALGVTLAKQAVPGAQAEALVA
jgi:hypothetical protein